MCVMLIEAKNCSGMLFVYARFKVKCRIKEDTLIIECVFNAYCVSDHLISAIKLLTRESMRNRCIDVST